MNSEPMASYLTILWGGQNYKSRRGLVGSVLAY